MLCGEYACFWEKGERTVFRNYLKLPQYPFDPMQWNSDSKFCSGILSLAQISGYELI